MGVHNLEGFGWHVSLRRAHCLQAMRPRDEFMNARREWYADIGGCLDRNTELDVGTVSVLMENMR
jgi:hypothetical protein